MPVQCDSSPFSRSGESTILNAESLPTAWVAAVLLVLTMTLAGCGNDEPRAPAEEAEPAGGEQEAAPETPAEDPGAELDRIIDAYLNFHFETWPDRATRAGVRGHDHRLPGLTEQDFDQRVESLETFIARLDELDSDSMTDLDHRVDHDLLGRQLRLQRAGIQDRQDWRREPRIYLPFGALNSLVTGDFADAGDRAEWLTSRLEALPDSLAAGRENLDNPPELFTREAIDSARAQREFFEATIPDFAAEVPEHEEKLTAAAEKALEHVEKWIGFLEGELLDRSGGELAIGREDYEFLLRELHGLEMDADELLELGQRYFDETQELLESQARTIDPDADWRELTERIRDDHPEADDLLDAYCREIQRSREHVIERGLVTVPDNEEVRCIDSDPSQRAFSPFGTFQTPAPFSDDKVGYLILHPIPDDISESRQEELLRSHDLTWIQVIAPHEAYPGHHLQAILAQTNERPLRRVFSTSIFTEGWGLYTEELMYEHDYFQPREETRLTQLRLRLWRAARVLLDAGIHTGQMDREEARQFLADETGMEYDATAGEVGIYLYRPSYALGYVLGFHEMMSLREDYRQQAGDDFDLREFHDRVLGLGSLPFPLVRKLLGLEE